MLPPWVKARPYPPRCRCRSVFGDRTESGSGGSV